LSDDAFEGESATVCLNDPAGQSESQAQAARCARSTAVSTKERLAYPFEVLGRDSYALIAHFDDDPGESHLAGYRNCIGLNFRIFVRIL